jgi:hypothetical protein
VELSTRGGKKEKEANGCEVTAFIEWSPGATAVDSAISQALRFAVAPSKKRFHTRTNTTATGKNNGVKNEGRKDLDTFDHIRTGSRRNQASSSAFDIGDSSLMSPSGNGSSTWVQTDAATAGGALQTGRSHHTRYGACSKARQEVRIMSTPGCQLSTIEAL